MESLRFSLGRLGAENIFIGGDGISVTVVVLEPTGSETHINQKVDNPRIVVVSKERFTVSQGESFFI